MVALDSALRDKDVEKWIPKVSAMTYGRLTPHVGPYIAEDGMRRREVRPRLSSLKTEEGKALPPSQQEEDRDGKWGLAREKERGTRVRKNRTKDWNEAL